MAVPALNVLALCAGYSGLELGVSRATGGRARAVCYVEREAPAAAVLVNQMARGALAPAHIWSDLGTFDGRPWRGAVDILTAGYPCQPESTAGKRAGAADERWIWPEVARIIGEVEPAIVFAENVAAHVTGTFRRVLDDLAALGFDVEWSCVSAAEVGAPHERERVFWLAAHPDRCVGPIGGRLRWLLDRERAACGDDVDGCGCERVCEAADTNGIGWQERSGERRESAGRPELAGYDEWTWPPPEPSICRVDDGATAGLAAVELMMAGNGVVPAQAAHAFCGLWARMMERVP